VKFRKSVMLYKIFPSMTTNKFSTELNEDISINDQFYSSQIYKQFFDNDYIHCEKKILLRNSNFEKEIQCYNTWYTQCMLFVRDNDFCENYQNPWKEYQYFLWMRNETLPVLPERMQGRCDLLCFIVKIFKGEKAILQYSNTPKLFLEYSGVRAEYGGVRLE
jgi:hypothetical protein